MPPDAAIVARQHAQDRIEPLVELKRTANDAGIGVQSFAPETVAHHCYLAAFVTLRIQAAQSRADAEHVEEIGAGGHLPRVFAVRSSVPIYVADDGFESKVLKGSGALKIAILGVGDLGVHAR